MSCTPIKKNNDKKPCENSELVITVKKKCIEEPETATTVPAPKPGPVVKTINGIKYFKLQSNYPGDYTKNCGLLGNEIDENFYFLRSNDIKTGWTEDCDNRKYLVLVKVDDEEIRIDITDNDQYQFKVEDGYIWIMFPDGTEMKLGDEYNGGEPVRFLIEGDNVHIVTDASIQGDGSYGNPIGVDLAYRTGTLEPADFFADLTCEDATLDSITGIGYGHAVVTKENVSRFGALYTWDQAKKIDEALANEGLGWRVPTSEDWGKLLNWAEGDCDDCKTHITERSGNFGCIAGSRLKSTDYWMENEDAHDGLDDFGLAIYPVGVCPENYNTREPERYGFTGLYKVASFWTSTLCERDGEPYARTFSYGHDDVAQFTESKKRRLSIRLVRDIDGDFDIPEYAFILGEYVPVTLTTDGKQLWTSFNISMMNYDGFNQNEVTVPEEWKDIVTDLDAVAYYKLTEQDEEYAKYELVDKYDLPSYADPEDADEWEIYVDEDAKEPYPTFTTAASSASPEYAKLDYTIHFDMLSEAKFFYNAWDGNRWHKRVLREGESVVLLYEDWPSPCVTGSTGDTYVTSENKNHEWRIFVNEQTGLDELVDTLDALKKEFYQEFKQINESMSAISGSVMELSGFVSDMYDEMQSGFSSAFTAISELQDELDVVEASVGLSGDGTFIQIRESGITASAETIAEAIGMLDDAILEDEETTAAALNNLNDRVIDLNIRVNAIEEAIDELQEEVDNIEEGVGLDEDGHYIQKDDTHYLNDATSVAGDSGETRILDEVAFSAMTEIEELQKKTIEPKDESIVVEVSGYTTYIGVNIDPDEEHLIIGENGIWFDGDFGQRDESGNTVADEDAYGF